MLASLNWMITSTPSPFARAEKFSSGCSYRRSCACTRSRRVGSDTKGLYRRQREVHHKRVCSCTRCTSVHGFREAGTDSSTPAQNDILRVSAAGTPPGIKNHAPATPGGARGPRVTFRRGVSIPPKHLIEIRRRAHESSHRLAVTPLSPSAAHKASACTCELPRGRRRCCRSFGEPGDIRSRRVRAGR